MTPIHELLNRIRWDKDFGQGQFEIGYYDRLEDTVHRIALQQVAFPSSQNRVFEFVDDTGQARRIPFHRIREVSKNGRIIWQRPAQSST